MRCIYSMCNAHTYIRMHTTTATNPLTAIPPLSPLRAPPIPTNILTRTIPTCNLSTHLTAIPAPSSFPYAPLIPPSPLHIRNVLVSYCPLSPSTHWCSTCSMLNLCNNVKSCTQHNHIWKIVAQTNDPAIEI